MQIVYVSLKTLSCWNEKMLLEDVMLKNEWHGDAFERLGVQSANQGAPEIILQGSWLFFTPSLAGQI